MRRDDHGRIYALAIVRITSVITLITACLAIPGQGSAATGSCQSPRATSPIYSADKGSGISATNQTSWRVGVLAITAKPAADIIVGFRAPADQNWHDSKPVSSKNASRLLLKVGAGDVQFSTLYRAASGSSACNNPPATTFSPNTGSLSSIAPNTTQPVWPATPATTNNNPTPNPNTNPAPPANNGGSNSGSTGSGTNGSAPDDGSSSDGTDGTGTN